MRVPTTTASTGVPPLKMSNRMGFCGAVVDWKANGELDNVVVAGGAVVTVVLSVVTVVGGGVVVSLVVLRVVRGSSVVVCEMRMPVEMRCVASGTADVVLFGGRVGKVRY